MAKMKSTALGLFMALSLAAPAGAAGLYTNKLPVVGPGNNTLPFNGNELIPMDTGLPNGISPQTVGVSPLSLLANELTQPGSGGFRNVLIGGDAGTNLWQRGTSVGPITGTLAYTADRWFAWSGVNTGFNVSQDTTAGEFALAYNSAFKSQRVAGQTGVVPICMAQEIESTSAFQFQGQVAEFSTHVFAGATWTGGTMSLAIVGGTGVDEGSARLAFGYNGGGGGGAGWTGQSTIVSGLVAPGLGTLGRFVAVGTVPAGIRELAAVACWTPTGTAGVSDYLVLSGVQLARNAGLGAFSGQVGPAYGGQTGLAGTIPAAGFERKPVGLEYALQQRYYQTVPEVAGAYLAPGMVSAANVERVALPLTNPMRVAPTCTVTTGGLNLNIGGTNTPAGTVTQVASTTGSVTLGGTVTGTAGATAYLNGTAGTGLVACSAEL